MVVRYSRNRLTIFVFDFQHYYLQDQLWFGVSLPPNISHFMFDTPDYLQDDALYLEVELHFDGIPIFTVSF